MMQTEITADTSAWNNLWAMEPNTLRKLLAAGRGSQSTQTKAPYSVANGVAVVPIVGPICKYSSIFNELFGGTSTVEVTNLIAKALDDDSVKSVTLYIDSPGGMIGGINDLSQFIQASKLQKPINAFVSDNCASAAYWVACSCSSIVANEGAFIGSIGVYSVIADTSTAAENAGVKVHLVSAGEYKGLLEPGLVIDEKALAMVQGTVNAIYDLFTNCVAEGRNLSSEAVKQLADGKSYIASQAKSLGLIDAIGSFQATLKGETMSENVKVKAASDAEPTPTDNQAADVSDGEKQILTAIAALSDKLDAVVKQLTDGNDDGADDSSDGESADDEDAGDVEASNKEASVEKALAADRARLKAISEAVGAKSDLAIKAFLDGKSAVEAKASLADVLKAENDELRKRAKVSRGVDPLAIGEAKSGTLVNDNDPETIWANNVKDIQKTYSGKKEYFLAALKHQKSVNAKGN